jgi:hypothetical protein
MSGTMQSAPPSALPGISPSRGEIGSFGFASSSAIFAIDAARGERVISPLEGEMGGRPEGGANYRPAENYQHRNQAFQ